MVPALQTRHRMNLDQKLQALIDLEAMNVTWSKWAPSESRTHSLGLADQGYEERGTYCCYFSFSQRSYKFRI